MLKNILLALYLSITLALCGAFAQEDTTTWSGTLDTKGKSLRLEIKIVDRDDQLSGHIWSIDQGNKQLDLADIKLDNKVFSFSIPQPGAKFSGTISDDGRTVSGTFQQGGGEMPLTLKQKRSTTTTNDTGTAPSLDERMAELGKTIEWYIEKNRAVGAELQIIQSGKTIYHESFGRKDRQDEQDWTNDTICNIRSMTKPITSAAAQILIDRGALELDKPVSSYLESFDNEKSREITVRQVLTHRSGLPLTNLMGPYQYKSLGKQVAAAGEKGPKFEPGKKFWYSDTGTDVVAALVEKISGETIDQFVTREILKPLKMNHSFYGIDADDERFSKVASLYIKTPKDWLRFWIPKKPLYPFAWGSQTLYSTTTDYAKFLRMMMNDGRVGNQQLLSKAAIERMLNPVSEMKMLGSDDDYPTGFQGLKTYYGQMMVTHRSIENKDAPPVIIGHSGSDGTNAWGWPDRDLIILYFTQSRGGDTPIKIEKPIDRLLINPGKGYEQSPTTETLVAAWIGNLEIGPGLAPVMQFRVVKKSESDETVAYFDSVTEGRTGFDATWSIDNDQLKFDVKKIGLTYRGKLNAEQDQAEGTWSQGGREFQLVLKKEDQEYDR